MIKTLVVSGCSFTMGGGLDNPNYHKYFESDAIYPHTSPSRWKEKAGRNGKKFCYKNNYAYYLSKLLHIPPENYKNFSIGGGGIYRTIQHIHTFLRTYKDNPSEIQIIYQIPAVNRVEVPKNYIDFIQFESINIKGEDNIHFKQWMKYFYNLETHWLNTLLELDKLNELCKIRNIPLILIDWNEEFGPSQTTSQLGGLLNKQPNGYDSIFRQMCKSTFDSSQIAIKKIISELPFFNVNEIITNPKNKIHTIVDGNVEIIDHHLDPNGAKLLGNYIFEKKFKEN